MTGAPGSLLIRYELDTTVEGLKMASRYHDEENPKSKQCTGDAHAYAVSGAYIANLPNTDPRLRRAARLISHVVVYAGAPNQRPYDLGANAPTRRPQVEVR